MLDEVEGMEQAQKHRSNYEHLYRDSAITEVQSGAVLGESCGNDFDVH